MGLVFRLSLASYSDSGSFLVACTSLSQDDSSEEDSGRFVRRMDCHLLFPFDLSQMLPGGSLLVCILYQDLLLYDR